MKLLKLPSNFKSHLGSEGFLDGTCRQDGAREQHELRPEVVRMRDLTIGLWIRARASPATAAESTGKRRAATAWIARTTSPALAAAAIASAASATLPSARASRLVSPSPPDEEGAELLRVLAMPFRTHESLRKWFETRERLSQGVLCEDLFGIRV